MPGLVRIGDAIGCGDQMGNGSPNVIVNNIPVSRLGTDLTTGHWAGPCFWPPVPIIAASPNVYVNNIPVNRLGDPIETHCCGPSCHSDNAVAGSPNVFANDGGAATIRVSIPPAVASALADAVDAYVSNPTAPQYKMPEDGQIKEYYAGTPDTSQIIVDDPPKPINPPNVPTPTNTGNRFNFVGGNQSVRAATNNPTGGGVTLSWPSGWTQNRGGIVSVIRPKSGAAVIPFLQRCLAQRPQWFETGMRGNPSNPRIIEIWRSLGFNMRDRIWQTDQTAWCAGFVHYVLQQSGLAWIPEAGARNTVARASRIDAVRVPIAEMQPGDIVLWSYSHVNFVYSRFE